VSAGAFGSFPVSAGLRCDTGHPPLAASPLAESAREELPAEWSSA
jgi:hypothetical protein